MPDGREGIVQAGWLGRPWLLSLGLRLESCSVPLT